jgi:hypothetical protein
MKNSRGLQNWAQSGVNQLPDEPGMFGWIKFSFAGADRALHPATPGTRRAIRPIPPANYLSASANFIRRKHNGARNTAQNPTNP